jgi:hypothetical protein
MDILEPVEVYSLKDPATAELLKNYLQGEGIVCRLTGEGQCGLAGILDIRLLVRATDADRAVKLIERHRKVLS